VLVVPSPKSQSHDIGLPFEVSVNWTGCPTVGILVLKTNDTLSVASLAAARLEIRCDELRGAVCAQVPIIKS
jgi:hypothetical protein